VGDLSAAEFQREAGVTKGTQEKENRVWQRWLSYLKSIDLAHDPFLQGLDSSMRTRIFGAFASALRRRAFSHPSEKDLGGSTVQEAVAKLGEIYRANVGYNPYHGEGIYGSGPHPSLARQFKGMKNLDPGTKQQKALPVRVYREIILQARLLPSNLSQPASAISQLLTPAFFWCMRSCEYSEVSGEHRTKLLCLRNIRFFNKDLRLIPHSSPLIFQAENVSITFEWQKKDVRDDIITHQHSGDKYMYPVLAAANLVSCISAYPISSDVLPDTPINTVILSGRKFQISSDQILSTIRRTVSSIGHEALGFGPDDVGTHSNRSGKAMGMFLTGTPVYTIMLIGRWSLDAFMRYTRKQVLEASHGISAKMLSFEDFYTIPDFDHNTDDGDRRTRNSSNLATTTSFNGSHSIMHRGLHPTFHLEH
jgi:hypothetical protein